MNKQAYSSEQEGILEHIPCHVMEYFFTYLIYLFVTWILLCDGAKYFTASHGIFCHATSMVCSKLNNGFLTLNMGLAKKVVKSSIV